MSSNSNDGVQLRTRGNMAIITINKPKKLNSMTRDDYYRLSCLMREIAEMPNITVTILTGTGRFFSAGADVNAPRPMGESGDSNEMRKQILGGFVVNNLDITRVFYQHPKVLVVALNGPAVGLSAGLLGWADFVYAAPHAYLLTPFASLGLVAEGGASYGLVQRLGISLAKEALMQSRKIDCDKLVKCGFVNKVFSGKDQKDSDGFLSQVIEEVEDKFGDHLNAQSILKMKELIHAPEMEAMEAQGVREVMAGMAVFMKGIPQEEFRKMASGEKRHKL